MTKLSNCFNKLFSNNMTVKSVEFNQVSLTCETQFFLFDSNAINKKMLDILSEKYLHKSEVLTLNQRKKPQAQQEFVISRILIKLLFTHQSNKVLNEIEIKFNEESLLLEVFYLDKLQAISMSLSHSKGLIFLALNLGNASLGVDVEYINVKRDVNLLAKNFYHLIEVEQIEQRGTGAFYRIWTLKEALSKHLKQSIVTTLKHNILKQLPLLSYQSSVYNNFDLSVVSNKTEPSSINNSINLLDHKDFINVLINTQISGTKNFTQTNFQY